MTNADAVIDGAAVARFTAEYGEELPPIAVVIAAYNEEHGIAGVVKEIPALIDGMRTAATWGAPLCSWQSRQWHCSANCGSPAHS